MLLRLRVLPRSSRNEIVGPMTDGVIKIKITAAAVDGKANEALIGLLSDHYGVAKQAIQIKSGEKSKNKIVEIID